MIIPILVWLSIVTVGFTKHITDCKSTMPTLLEDQFTKPTIDQYPNGFSLMFNDNVYTVDLYFTTSEESHNQSLEHGYKSLGTCLYQQQEMFISKMKITNQIT